MLRSAAFCNPTRLRMDMLQVFQRQVFSAPASRLLVLLMQSHKYLSTTAVLTVPPCSQFKVKMLTTRNMMTGFTQYRNELPTTDEDLEKLSKSDKVVKVKLSTTRLDGILKAGLHISKNKIEKAFYEDRIRLNGERPRKKSQLLHEGDEVDIVRGPNKINTEFIDISRVEIVRLKEDAVGEDEDAYTSDDEKSETKIPAVLKRYKSLTIENYDDPWKGSVAE